ncbi:AraC family transcriptional regulator ligand-binding domain-containing protein [Nocardia concava]|uniref:AraC family transcriptional regulator ligand-binding domain-containing protein n=1 Tax=Nocardia concava TaxID=257281 RepID=UPI0003135248|nr:AraC family transcriptional regulator ligand-binding domain-containing protein [Nocardia concava]
MADTLPGPSNDVAEQRSLPRAATVSSHLASVLAEAALAAGAGDGQVAQLLGRDPARPSADDERVPTVTVSRLWELLRRLAGPEAGVLAAERAVRGRLYVWDYLISNARTLAEGLRDAARFNSTMCDPGVALEVVEDGSLLTARYLDIPHREPIDALSKEFALTVTARRAREGFGEAGVPVRVDFSHSAPADRRYLVRALGTGNLHFDQGRDAITFLTSNSSGSSNDPVLQQILLSHARQVLAA